MNIVSTIFRHTQTSYQVGYRYQKIKLITQLKSRQSQLLLGFYGFHGVNLSFLRRPISAIIKFGWLNLNCWLVNSHQQYMVSSNFSQTLSHNLLKLYSYTTISLYNTVYTYMIIYIMIYIYTAVQLQKHKYI